MHTARLAKPAPQAKASTESVKARQTKGNLAQMADMAAASETVGGLVSMQMNADLAVIQRAKTKNDYASPSKDGNKKGKFVGAPHGCHIHIVSDNSHFKVGTSDRTRMDFDPDTYNDQMQEAYDEVRTQYSGKPGYANCIAWFQAKGCT